jgi:hypothetical protein
MFDNFDLPELPPGLAWALGPGDVTVFLTIRATLAGDYNNDGAVNAADYVLWRKAETAGLPLANETATPGTTDAADYDEWRKNFGATISGTGGRAQATAPEPVGTVLAIYGVLMAGIIVADPRITTRPRRHAL